MLALAVSAASCSGGPPAQGATGPPPPVPVELVTLEPQPIEQLGEFVGTLKSLRSTTVQPQVEGFITRILVKSGARVTPGTTLFEIDAAMQAAAVSSLEAQRAAREAEVEFTRQQAGRAKALLDAGAMSQQEHEQALTQRKNAEAQLKSIEDQIRQQRTELAYYRVVAQTAGVVGDVPVRVGERVTRSTELTTIDDNAGLEVYINVPVQQAPRLTIGLPVRIVNDAGDEIDLTRVSFVAASVDDATQTVLAKAPVRSRPGQLRSDQFVRTQIVWSTEPGLTVPVVAVQRINNQHFVFVAEPGSDGQSLVARQRSITLGPVQGNHYLLTAGLKPGERVILAGTQKIGEGAPVQAVPVPAPAPAGSTGGGA